MLTKTIKFFDKDLKINTSAIIPIKYNFEFHKDINDLLNKLMTFGLSVKNDKDKKDKKVNFKNMDFNLLTDSIELAYVMLKYADNSNFEYKDYEDFLSNFEFMDLATKSVEIVGEYISSKKATYPPRTKSKKNKMKGR